MKLHKDIVEAIKENKLYDHMANHGWRYSKDELIHTIKELAFAVYLELKDDEIKVYDKMLDENETADE